MASSDELKNPRYVDDTRNKPQSISELLDYRATQQPDERAYVSLSDRGDEEQTLTFAELHKRVAAFAAKISERTQCGERALLLFPPGLEFIVAFLGCLAAGVIAVPVMVPRRSSSRD
jgi:acyl-CoA synthetase (AMP-forming)/AMP-acid ligase II